MVDLGCLLLSIALLCCSVVMQPRRAVCIPGFYVNGIRPSGVYECRCAPGGSPLYDGAAGYPDRTVDRPGWYVGQIHCTGGSHPIVVLATRDSEARVVGCQR